MVPRPSALFVSTAALLSTAAFAAPTRSGYQEPLEDGTLGEPPVAKYPFKNDAYDRKHDTYGEGVQPLPIVREHAFAKTQLQSSLAMVASVARRVREVETKLIYVSI